MYYSFVTDPFKITCSEWLVVYFHFLGVYYSEYIYNHVCIFICFDSALATYVKQNPFHTGDEIPEFQSSNLKAQVSKCLFAFGNESDVI